MYVLLLFKFDVTPHSVICKDLVFTIAHDNEVIECIRVESSNIEKKDWDNR